MKHVVQHGLLVNTDTQVWVHARFGNMIAEQCMNQNLSVGALLMQCYAYVDFIVSKFDGCNVLLFNKIECKREVVCEYDVLVVCLCKFMLNCNVR